MWLYKKLSNLLSRLVALNSIVILFVILLAGLSVKDYACYLVNSEQVVGQELVATLNGFLWKVGIFAFVIAGLFHYFTVKKIIGPINHLSRAAKEMKEGKSPAIVKITSSGEMKELIENFNSMSETLISVQEQREKMLRDIAHELRTPLTNINGYLEALQNNVVEGDPELFGSLLEESRRITRIVELITELNFWNHGNYFLEKEFVSVEMKPLLTETLTTFQLKLAEKFVDIDIDINQAVIVGNPDGLKQVVTNLLQNILNYNIGSRLQVHGAMEGNQYKIRFSHEGQRIDPDKKEKIFERFYRIEESRSTKADGAGLGLAIAKSIITAHHGKIALETNGTNHAFSIELPVKE
ncbi:two-component system, OmpR family, sensor histidine kinase BaeS [Mesobacillus persicus]|uniref:histidine kinase n=1 Tax=Mesobacillus persicus TaxID=930146 RepID=A0A1H7Z818_9BACI|nr:ATP-binding protein [Mesobacillus persicus]SEM54405.1 two-component system, OmpR family, sensor histidine kinase BaeS [Mesobacillus persicus]